MCRYRLEMVLRDDSFICLSFGTTLPRILVSKAVNCRHGIVVFEVWKVCDVVWFWKRHWVSWLILSILNHCVLPRNSPLKTQRGTVERVVLPRTAGRTI